MTNFNKQLGKVLFHIADDDSKNGNSQSHNTTALAHKNVGKGDILVLVRTNPLNNKAYVHQIHEIMNEPHINGEWENDKAKKEYKYEVKLKVVADSHEKIYLSDVAKSVNLKNWRTFCIGVHPLGMVNYNLDGTHSEAKDKMYRVYERISGLMNRIK